ncbi:hypothetical protein ACED47_01820, partial [Vibrio splendidus]
AMRVYLIVFMPNYEGIRKILAFVTWRRYELRAEFKGADETGDHWVSVARGCTREEFKVLKNVELALRDQVS